MEARRLAAAPQIRQGDSLSAIARRLGVSRQVVHQWAQRLRRRGRVELFWGKRLDKGAVLWQDYTELKDLRDGLVHYKVANRLFYNMEELLKKSEKGIRTVSAVIKNTYREHHQYTGYLATFDGLP